MRSAREMIHDKYPNTKTRSKVMCFYYLFLTRTVDIRNRLHKKRIKDIDYVVFPTKLAEMCLGKNYSQFYNDLEDLQLLKRVEIGTNKFGFDVHAFRPLKFKLRYMSTDKKFRDNAILIYERFLDKYSDRDSTARILKKNIARTTYRNKPMRNVVHKDNFAGRYYHYLTNVPNRQRLLHTRIDGEKIVELDVEQCQIRILQKVLMEMDQAHTFTSWMDNDNELYTHIKDNFNIRTRKEAKQYVFRMLFGHYNSRASKKMYRLFPDLEYPLKLIKSHWNYDNPSRKIYSNLARLLQMHEVKMLQKLAFRLDYCEIPFLSIHDSVLIKESDKELAMELFQEVVEENLNKAVVKSKSI